MSSPGPADCTLIFCGGSVGAVKNKKYGNYEITANKIFINLLKLY